MTYLAADPFELSNNRIHMEEGPRMRPLAVTADFWERLADDPQLTGGRLLSFYSANEPGDVHPDVWEMHPEGDELLIVCSGALDLELERSDSTCTVGLSPQTAFIVPAGIWHRLLLNEPSVLIAITNPSGTKHKRADGR
ncbi:mannose-6-phosphate isomerase-like protein (cupin superfamily) [Pseudorhizobium tarimense]|uniref:Mannose-6-phosphate isomerase-like protein (Cupin superfamily) n=1 Tax=Pseudorhizobium tarimense TaxID=1079109 RepID=A0ABV2H6B6_9HYPH|nr:cupin domain-containing protein [Pseudorhizobium tarimense]MCJ8519084.1 cupin domain-containing protein [Pseudorhizobium tarimense]